MVPAPGVGADTLGGAAPARARDPVVTVFRVVRRSQPYVTLSGCANRGRRAVSQQGYLLAPGSILRRYHPHRGRIYLVSA